jgi:gas vesicle protein
MAPSAPSAGDIQSSAGTVKNLAERNPLGLAFAGAALGFVLGLFAPSTRIEDEKIGPVTDQLKSHAAEAGQEALDHGTEIAQEVVQAAAHTAVETAKTTGKEHGDELAASLNEKAREVTPAS